MYAIDTNLLVYAHNKDSHLNKEASEFLGYVMNTRDEDGNLAVCIPAQVLTEFVNAITRQNVQKPLSLAEAVEVIKDYIDSGIRIIYQKETQLQTLIELLTSIKTRRKVFDVALVATLKDNGISGLYTVNVGDFEGFGFLEVVNPLDR